MIDNIPQSNTEAAPVQEKEFEKAVTTTPETKVVETPQTDTQEDPNWKAFREARKRDRLEREAAERKAKEKEAEALALKAALEAALDKRPAPQQQQYYQDSFQPEESEDERIEKKVLAAIAAKEAEFNRQREQREQQEYPQRLNQQYPDFNEVVTQENLDYLEYHYPEIARAFQRVQNDYTKWEDIYRATKRLVPNSATAKKDAVRAEQNIMRPKSMSSIGASQTTDATPQHRLSDDRKAANWERMQRTLKGLS